MSREQPVDRAADGYSLTHILLTLIIDSHRSSGGTRRRAQRRACDMNPKSAERCSVIEMVFASRIRVQIKINMAA